MSQMLEMQTAVPEILKSRSNDTLNSGSTEDEVLKKHAARSVVVRQFHTTVKQVFSADGDAETLGSGLYATKAFQAGAIVMHAHIAAGNIKNFKTMHSIQIGEDEMWDCHNESDVCMLMHAYDPNCMLRVVEVIVDQIVIGRSMLVIARRPIQVDESLTLNYNSFEFAPFSCPFTCFETGRRVDGFQNARDDEKEFLLNSGLAFPHIRRMHLGKV
jgi:hypothetical protein